MNYASNCLVLVLCRQKMGQKIRAGCSPSSSRRFCIYLAFSARGASISGDAIHGLARGSPRSGQVGRWVDVGWLWVYEPQRLIYDLNALNRLLSVIYAIYRYISIYTPIYP